MRCACNLTSLMIAAALSSSAFASQGPGVGAGAAGPFAQLAASSIVGVMIAFGVFALIKAARGRLR